AGAGAGRTRPPRPGHVTPVIGVSAGRQDHPGSRATPVAGPVADRRERHVAGDQAGERDDRDRAGAEPPDEPPGREASLAGTICMYIRCNNNYCTCILARRAL
ncbi:MAG TPA: hypothetical protein VKV33_03950, partial [Streptosporangiaceae bacterium]|nr:hypothetical protein [Streptosporangiaceae bacterium]